MCVSVTTSEMCFVVYIISGVGRPKYKEFASSANHHHHIWLNNPGRITASLKIFRQASLFLAAIHQLLIFSLFTSSMIPSIHLNLGLPTLLLPNMINISMNIIVTLSKTDSNSIEVGLGLSWQHSIKMVDP